MSRPEVPKRDQAPLEFMKWFVLAVTLSPMLCCAGCLGYGFLVARFQQPEGPPSQTAPAGTGERR
jgi:nitrate reductase NapE component